MQIRLVVVVAIVDLVVEGIGSECLNARAYNDLIFEWTTDKGRYQVSVLSISNVESNCN